MLVRHTRHVNLTILQLRISIQIVVLCGLLLTGCDGQSEDSPAPAPGTPPTAASAEWFQDVTRERRLSFIHDVGPVNDYHMADITGSGGAALDYNNDGRMDLLLIQNGGPDTSLTSRMYRQEIDGAFTDVTQQTHLSITGYGMAATCGDVNNDGWIDVLVSLYTGNRLFINEQGRFTEVSPEQSGIKNPYWAVGGTFADFDRDGRLDLVVVNYVALDDRKVCRFPHGIDYCAPFEFQHRPARLYQNVTPSGAGADQVKFIDISRPSGIEYKAAPGLAAICADFTGDGWADIFIANDGAPNHLWVNQHDLTFEEEAATRGASINAAGVAQANMGIGFGDADANGLLDLYITHLPSEGHVLWIQDAPGLFRDATMQTGLGRSSRRTTGFGTVMADFDNDVDQDIAVGAGAVLYPSAAYTPPEETVKRLGPHWARYAENNQLFENNNGRFHDVSAAHPEFCGESNVVRGVIVADFDNDGGQDLVACRVGTTVALYRNVAPNRGNWLLVRVVDQSAGGRDAYGAMVTVESAGNAQVGCVSAAESYMASNDPRLHFGLGKASGADAVHVLWPDGSREQFGPFQANQVIVLSKGTSAAPAAHVR